MAGPPRALKAAGVVAARSTASDAAKASSAAAAAASAQRTAADAVDPPLADPELEPAGELLVQVVFADGGGVLPRPLRTRSRLPIGRFWCLVETAGGGKAQVAFEMTSLAEGQPPVVVQAEVGVGLFAANGAAER